MRTTIAVVAGALLAGGFAASAPADAKPRVSCHLLRDAANDTHIGTPQAAAPSDEPQLDIVAADVAVDNRWVTVAVDVRSLQPSGLPAGVEGPWRWSVRFTAAGTTYMFHGRLGQGGAFGQVLRAYILDDSTDSWAESGPSARATVHLDQQRRQIRVTVPRHALDPLGGVPLGERITNLHAYSWHEHTSYTEYFNQPGGEYDLADTAQSTASYVAGSASCVKPGS